MSRRLIILCTEVYYADVMINIALFFSVIYSSNVLTTNQFFCDLNEDVSCNIESNFYVLTIICTS